MTKYLPLAAAILSLAAAPTAKAITISGSVGGAPTGVNRLNFDDLTPGSAADTAIGPNGTVNVSFVPDGQGVTGAAAGLYAAPFLSGGNGNGFGPGSSNQANGVDTTVYLTTGTGQVILDFGGSSSLSYFGILWGSVDAYNTLLFYNGNTLVDTVTGSQVIGLPVGDQGINGTSYVNINTSASYNKVVMLSSQYAFEFDNVAYSNTAFIPGVPDGGTTVALLGMGLTGLAYFRRKLV